MKVFGIASLLLVSSASALRGASEVEKEYSPEARKLADDALQFHRKLGQEGKYNAYDNGAGCNCAKGAVQRISSEHAEAMQGVPLVTLAMLELHKKDVWPTIMTENGGEEYEPLQFYKYTTDIVEQIVCWANCILLQIDCNQCGVDGERPEVTSTTLSATSTGTSPNSTTLPATSTGTSPTVARRKLNTDTPYEGISIVDCCCHVDAITKLVIGHMNDYFFKALLNPGGAAYAFSAMHAALETLIQGVEALADPFLKQFNPYTCKKPEFPAILELGQK